MGIAVNNGAFIVNPGATFGLGVQAGAIGFTSQSLSNGVLFEDRSTTITEIPNLDSSYTEWHDRFRAGNIPLAVNATLKSWDQKLQRLVGENDVLKKPALSEPDSSADLSTDTNNMIRSSGSTANNGMRPALLASSKGNGNVDDKSPAFEVRSTPQRTSAISRLIQRNPEYLDQRLAEKGPAAIGSLVEILRDGYPKYDIPAGIGDVGQALATIAHEHPHTIPTILSMVREVLIDTTASQRGRDGAAAMLMEFSQWRDRGSIDVRDEVIANMNALVTAMDNDDLKEWAAHCLGEILGWEIYAGRHLGVIIDQGYVDFARVLGTIAQSAEEGSELRIEQIKVLRKTVSSYVGYNRSMVIDEEGDDFPLFEMNERGELHPSARWGEASRMSKYDIIVNALSELVRYYAKLLQTCCNDSDQAVAEEAARALEEATYISQSTPTVEQIIAELNDSEHPLFTMRAIRYLGHENEAVIKEAWLQLDARKTLPTSKLIEALRHDNPLIRIAAAELLGRHRIGDAIPSLTARIFDQEAAVSAAAQEALININGDISLERLNDALRSERRHVRRAGAALLTMMADRGPVEI